MKKYINNFHNTNPYTIGIEEEYMLCDPLTGELIDRANEIMDMLDNKYKERYSYELLLSEIEANTSICNTIKDVMYEISDLRKNVREYGKVLGFNIGISGTHPTAICNNQKFVDNESYNWVSNQLHYYAKRNVTFAMHVHIAVKNEYYAIHANNSLRQWIAPLLCLSTNSPFFESTITGMRSSRSMQFGVFPRTNIPIEFNNFEDYIKLIDLYSKCDSIMKPRQIWWKIRPHIEFNTVEFRVCDAQRGLENIEMIIGIVQALVRTINVNEDFNHNYQYEYLTDSLWKASSNGLDSTIIDPYDNKIITMKDMVRKMLDYCNDSLKYFGNIHVRKSVENILHQGTESDKQLEIFDKFGMDYLKKYLIKTVEY